MRIAMQNVDSIGSIDRMFAPVEDTGFREYLRDRSEQTARHLERAGSRIRDGFRERARKIFDAANSSEALRKARQAVRSLKGVKRANMIYDVENVDDLRAAGFKMQRFLMANPLVRRGYLKQTVDGYSESYLNQHGKDIGVDHYDYRRVVNGVYRRDKNEEGEDIFAHEVFYENLIEDDRELDAEEQFMILNAWELQKLCMEAGLDSTNRLGGATL